MVTSREILEWIIVNSIEGEFLAIAIVPEEGNEEWEQNEEWWIHMFGGTPPNAQSSGEYLYFYSDTIDDESINGHIYDFEIELGTARILFFKIQKYDELQEEISDVLTEYENPEGYPNNTELENEQQISLMLYDTLSKVLHELF